jgi:Flp pilus assembly secretin CpaC
LSLSVTVALAQGTLLPATCAPGASPIWQKISGASNSSTSSRVRAKSSAQTTAIRPHSMLLLSGPAQNLNSVGSTKAALTIHGSLPTTPESVPGNAQPNEVAKSIAKSEEESGKALLAQLPPDNLVAQNEGQPVSVTPIPPVVSGTLDMEEFKSTNVIDLKVSQSRTFKTKNKIVRTSISEPSIAEPVVVAENQIVLLGKSPGTATMVLWDDAGNSVAIDLRVSRDFSQLQSTLREIDPRIVAKSYSVGGSDRVILLGDVDHPESVIRAFAAANVFMDDRGLNIQVANNRLINTRVGEQGGAGGAGGGQTGLLSQLSSVDKYTFFPNLNNNIGRAQLITSDGGRVTSLVKVRKIPLIVLHVAFLEMNTAAARAIGVQLGLNLTTATFSAGIGGSNAAAGNQAATFSTLLAYPGYQINGASGLNNLLTSFRPAGFIAVPAQQFPQGLVQNYTGIGQGTAFATAPPSLLPVSALFGAPGGTTFGTAIGNLLNMFTSSSPMRIGHGSMSINPSIQGSIEHNRARILAEPTLVTVSGERASFLAGGEVPILQQLATAGTAQQSITYEPFGLRLNIIPILQENGTINLEISPEERILSTANELEFVGSSTPILSFTTRKSQTIVELKPGQELYIAGLITTNNGREVDKTPLLGEIPVLGALYRSKAFAKNESELVVSVRPEIILPGTPGQLKIPEEVGRVEGVRDTNLFQVEPTVIDERHYTSGRAERYQKTSPTLPEGAPIPDSQ